MNWKQLLDDGRAERQATSAEALGALRAVVERNLKDARVDAVSPDTRFGCGYEEDARYFDRCRRLRNEFSYEAAGVVDEREVAELLGRVARLQERVRDAVESRFRGAWS